MTKKYTKVLAFILAGSLLLSACGGRNTSVPDKETEASVSVSSQASENPESVPEKVPASEKEAAKKVNFDTSTTYQTWEGFGAAYTWYGDRLLNAKNSAEGLDRLFTDAKLTVLRFKNEYGYAIPGKAENAVAIARNYKEARDRAAEYGEGIKTLLCCWSPPAYLKSDDVLKTGNGTLKKNADGEYMYKEYAEWWAESVAYYQARGVKIDYVSIQNEVDFSPKDYEGCRFGIKETDTVASYAKAYIAVYEAFREKFGEDAPVMLAPETMGCEPYDLYAYTKDIVSYDENALGGLAFHLYASGVSNEEENTVKAISYMTQFSGINRDFENTRKWQTEFFIGRGIQTAELIWYALTTANLNAYLYWSAVWDDSTPKKFESADLIEINNSGKWRESANYYVMRHYSEFIRPGYVRIEGKCENAAIRTTVFANENKSKLGMVLVNTSDKDVAVQLSGKEYTITDTDAYQSVFGDAADFDSSMYASLGKLTDSTVTLPAKSVTTIDVTGYEGNTPVEVPKPVKITYDTEVNTAVSGDPAPTKDVTILDCDFSSREQVSLLSGFGSATNSFLSDGGKDGKGCLLSTNRKDAWHGPSISAGNFEHYGYKIKISFDVMTMAEGTDLSCTSTFTVNKLSKYPEGEENRVACSNMKAGKWYHLEGYSTMYKNMDEGSFMIYWETPTGTEDIYLDNLKVTILYTEEAGEYN